MSAMQYQCPGCGGKLVKLSPCEKFRCTRCWRIIMKKDVDLAGQLFLPIYAPIPDMNDPTQSQSEHDTAAL